MHVLLQLIIYVDETWHLPCRLEFHLILIASRHREESELIQDLLCRKYCSYFFSLNSTFTNPFFFYKIILWLPLLSSECNFIYFKNPLQPLIIETTSQISKVQPTLDQLTNLQWFRSAETQSLRMFFAFSIKLFSKRISGYQKYLLEGVFLKSWINFRKKKFLILYVLRGKILREHICKQLLFIMYLLRKC